jgi:hypothetical protein
MRCLFVIVICVLFSGFSVGCGSNSSVSPRAESDGALTTEQLSAALGIRHWKYRVPDNIGDKLITLKVEGGPAPTITGGINGWEPGEIVTICVRSLLPNNALECTLIGDRGYSRSMISNSFLSCRSVQHSPNGSFIGDKPLIKGNLTGSVSMTADAPDDISLVVSLQETEEPAAEAPAK